MKKYIISLLCIILSANVFAGLSLPSFSSPSRFVLQGTTVKFDVSDVSGATIYQFEYSINSDLSNATTLSSSISEFTEDDLKIGKRYYWRYRVKSSTDSSLWSSIFYFNVAKWPDGVFPKNLDAEVSVRDVFKFEMNNLKNFIIEIDTTANFNSNIYYRKFFISDTFSSDTAEIEIDSLFFGKKYYWRIRGYNGQDSGDWRNYEFKVLEAPVIIGPPIFYDYLNADLVFKKFNNGQYYHLQMDTNGGSNMFINPIVDTIITDTSFFFEGGKYGRSYYWRVKVMTELGYSNYAFKFFKTPGITNKDNFFRSEDVTEKARLYNIPAGIFKVIAEYDTTESFNSNAKITRVHNIQDTFGVDKQLIDTLYNLYFGVNYKMRAKYYGVTDSIDWVFFLHNNSKVSGYFAFNYPSKNSNQNTPLTYVSWYAGRDGITYQVQLDTTPLFNSPQLKDTILEDEATSSTMGFYKLFELNTKYYRRIRGFHSLDTSKWSPVDSFSTYNRPVRRLPGNTENNDSIKEVERTFSWDNKFSVRVFELQIDTTTSFNSTALIDTIGYFDDNEVKIGGQYYGTTYYWRVRTIFDTIKSQWSDTGYYTTSQMVDNYEPIDGSSGIDVSTNAWWYPIFGSTGYQIQVDTMSNLSTAKTITKAGYNSFSHQFREGELYFGDTNYWRMRLFNKNDTTEWTRIKYFKTSERRTIGLSYPINNGTTIMAYDTLRWRKPPEPNTTYTLVVSEESDFYNIKLYTGIKDTFKAVILKPNTKYYWKVYPKNYDPTDAWSFTTGNSYPKVKLSLPENNKENLGSNIWFSWMPGIAESYEFELSANPDMSSPIKATVNEPKVYQSELNSSIKYYWRVRVKTEYGVGDWSEVFTFNTYKTSVNNIEDANISVYPNPSKGVFTIAKTDGLLTGSIYIYNMLNEQVYSIEKQNSSNIHIDLSKQPAGVYCLRYKEGERVYTVKIIKQ